MKTNKNVGEKKKDFAYVEINKELCFSIHIGWLNTKKIEETKSW